MTNKLLQKAIEFNTPNIAELITTHNNNNIIELMTKIEQHIGDNEQWLKFFNANFYDLTTEQVCQKLAA